MLLPQAVPLNKQRLQRTDAAKTFSTISTQRLDFTQQELPDAAAWAIPERVAYSSNFSRFRRLIRYQCAPLHPVSEDVIVAADLLYLRSASEALARGAAVLGHRP